MARLLEEEAGGGQTAKARLEDLIHFRGLKWDVDSLLLYSPGSMDIAWLSYPVMGAKGMGVGDSSSALPAPTHCLDDWGAFRGPGMPPLWPVGLPYPICVSTIFALYNRTLYTIKSPSPRPTSLCLEGRGLGHGSCLQSSWGFWPPGDSPQRALSV